MSTTWTRSALMAECHRQATIHRLEAEADEVAGHHSGAVFHARKSTFWSALLVELTEAPVPAVPA